MMPKSKRTTSETEGRARAEAARADAAQAVQIQCARANLLARKLTDGQVKDIRTRRENGETFAAIGRAYSLDEFTAARVDRYGRLSPWQYARHLRNAGRTPLQEAWAKRNKGQLPAS
jgi:hypothetical protein